MSNLEKAKECEICMHDNCPFHRCINCDVTEILSSVFNEIDRLNKDLAHATQQWNIWCKAYNELADSVNQMPYD